MSTSNFIKRTRKDEVSGHAYKILKQLDCGKNVREETMSIIERAENQRLLEQGTPKALAAGAVYIACILCEDRMTLDTIGGAIGLSGSVVSKSYMTIARGLGFSER